MVPTGHAATTLVPEEASPVRSGDAPHSSPVHTTTGRAFTSSPEHAQAPSRPSGSQAPPGRHGRLWAKSAPTAQCPDMGLGGSSILQNGPMPIHTASPPTAGPPDSITGASLRGVQQGKARQWWTCPWCPQPALCLPRQSAVHATSPSDHAAMWPAAAVPYSPPVPSQWRQQAASEHLVVSSASAHDTDQTPESTAAAAAAASQAAASPSAAAAPSSDDMLDELSYLLASWLEPGGVSQQEHPCTDLPHSSASILQMRPLPLTAASARFPDLPDLPEAFDHDAGLNIEGHIMHGIHAVPDPVPGGLDEEDADAALLAEAMAAHISSSSAASAATAGPEHAYADHDAILHPQLAPAPAVDMSINADPPYSHLGCISRGSACPSSTTLSSVHKCTCCLMHCMIHPGCSSMHGRAHACRRPSFA